MHTSIITIFLVVCVYKRQNTEWTTLKAHRFIPCYMCLSPSGQSPKKQSVEVYFWLYFEYWINKKSTPSDCFFSDFAHWANSVRFISGYHLLCHHQLYYHFEVKFLSTLIRSHNWRLKIIHLLKAFVVLVIQIIMAWKGEFLSVWILIFQPDWLAQPKHRA